MITAVIPVSPIPSHPSTAILEETVASIRHHHPDAEIILTFDGVRDEQAHMRQAYEEHLARVLWLADKQWRATVPFLFDRHTHQVGMMRRAVDEITTPLVLYVEQDTPIVTDWPIDWQLITDLVLSADANVVRLYHEAVVPESHAYLMRGRDGDFIRTQQWSQRPHLASTEYYRKILAEHFTPQALTFIEDKMHSVAQCDPWETHRIHIYAPEPNFKRSYHLDGRAGAPKYDEELVF